MQEGKKNSDCTGAGKKTESRSRQKEPYQSEKSPIDALLLQAVQLSQRLKEAAAREQELEAVSRRVTCMRRRCWVDE